MLILSIAAAGFVGAVARFWLGTAISERYPARLPWATFLINVSGAFALGLLAGSATMAPAVRIPLGVGFLGAYTTFSTWMLETTRLRPRLALLYVAISTVTGLLAAAAGLVTARWLAW